MKSTKTFLAALALIFMANHVFAQADLEISGQMSWETLNGQASARIEIERLTNESSDRVSGTVHVYMRATMSPDIFSSGYDLAEINMANYTDDLGRLGPGEGWQNISISVPFDPPPSGTYYTHFYIAEYPNLGTALDYFTFASTTNFGSAAPPPPATDDHSDTFAGASNLGPNGSLRGILEANGDQDVFRINVTQTGTLRVSSSGGTDTVGTLYNAGQLPVGQDDDLGGDFNFSFEVSVSAGTYYLVVSGYQEATTGSYGVVSSFIPDGGFTPPGTPPVTPPETSGREGGGGASGLPGILFLLFAIARRRLM